MVLPADVIKQRDALLKVALGYEQLEADIIMTAQCWETESGLPQFTGALWDRMIDLQTERNAAIELAGIRAV